MIHSQLSMWLRAFPRPAGRPICGTAMGFGRWGLLGLVALGLGICAAAADDGRPSPPDMDPSKKSISIGIQQEPDNLHPVFMQMSASSEIAGDILRPGPIFVGLTVRGSDWQLRPLLAEAIPTVANGQWKIDPEKRTMTTVWHIRKEACWEDGTPLTADDFVFAFQVKSDVNVPVSDNTMEKRIREMRAEGPDRKTLVVEWKELYAYADESHMALPRHIEESVYRKNPIAYKETPYCRTPVGNGPYKLKEWVAGSHIILERNPNWWGPAPRLDQLIYKIIPDTNTLVANLQAGVLDVISPVGISFDQALEIDKHPVEGFEVIFTPGLVWEHIDFNLDSPIVGDKRVRHALQYAIDREKMVKEYFEGRQEAAHSWLPPKHYGYHPNLPKYGYDLKKAAALLEEAGWKKGADGVRVNAKGEPLALTIITTAGNKVRENIEQILSAQWKRIGVQLKIANQDANVFFDRLSRREYPHLAMYAWTMDPNSDGENMWTEAQIPSQANGWVGQNNPGLRHPEIDRIDHLIPVTLDKAKRIELFHQEQALWVEELPSILLYFRTEGTVVRKSLRGWLPTGTSTGVTWNCNDWYFAK